MENRASRIIKIAFAIVVVLIIGVVGGLITTAVATDIEEDYLLIETETYRSYTFTQDGYKIWGHHDLIPHTGDYILTGRANEDVLFTSNNGEPVTYNVILHNWAAEAETWYALLKVEAGVTLNITAYGDNVILGDNHPGISAGEMYENSAPPVVNLTVMENSSVKIGCQAESTGKIIGDEIVFNLSENITSSVDMSIDGWKNGMDAEFTKGTGTSHKTAYVYIDDETCKLDCPDCDIIDKSVSHSKDYFSLNAEAEDYDTMHIMACYECKHIFETAPHSIKYGVDEESHTVYCELCYYTEEAELHTLDENGCTVCNSPYIASVELAGNTTKYLTVDGLKSAEKGGKITFLADVDDSNLFQLSIPEGYDTIIDIAGNKVNGLYFYVSAGAKLTVIDSGENEKGEIKSHERNSTYVYGELILDGVTLIDNKIFMRDTGKLTAKDSAFKDTQIFAWDESGAELTNITSTGELHIDVGPERAESFNIYSGSFENITAGSYGGMSVNLLLPQGYAFSGENGVINGGGWEISGVTSIVAHESHNEDGVFFDDSYHWISCACGYYSDTIEIAPHTKGEGNVCTECENKLVAQLNVGETEQYYLSAAAAFEFANQVGNSKVTLLCDTEIETVDINEDIVLDLNGYTLVLSVNRIYVYNKLTVNDSSAGQTGKIDAEDDISYAIQIHDGASLVVNGGEIFGLIFTINREGVEKYVEINGGKFTGEEKFRLGEKTTLVINNGWFENSNGVFSYWGSGDISVTINGGVFANCTLISEYSHLMPTLSELLGTDEGCERKLLWEDGTEVLLNSADEYCEGIMVVAHVGSVLTGTAEGHAFSCPSCEEKTYSIPHNSFVYGEEPEDAEKHTVTCGICEYKLESQKHQGGESTCTERAVCSLCELPYGEEPEGHKYDNACDTDCNICKETREVEDHKYDNACDVDCNICKETRQVEDHKYDNACDVDCNICKEIRQVEGHKYTNNCDTGCDICGETREITHAFGNDGKCSVCGAADPSYVPPTTDSSNTTNNSTATDSSGTDKAPSDQNNNQGGSQEDEGISTGAVVGIVIGSTAVAGGGIFTLIWFVIRKRRLLP